MLLGLFLTVSGKFRTSPDSGNEMVILTSLPLDVGMMRDKTQHTLNINSCSCGFVSSN